VSQPLAAGVLAGALASLGAHDELQALLVALLSLAVREAIYWWQHRKRPNLSTE
jgi:hypothetical protein